jgi:hypothetical protein
MVLTVSFEVSPETGLDCLRHRQKRFCRFDTSVGVSGRHDFAVRIRRLRHSRRTRPPHPAPNVRDDRETPLLIGRRTAKGILLILAESKAYYFSNAYWTPHSCTDRMICPPGKNFTIDITKTVTASFTNFRG